MQIAKILQENFRCLQRLNEMIVTHDSTDFQILICVQTHFEYIWRMSNILELYVLISCSNTTFKSTIGLELTVIKLGIIKNSPQCTAQILRNTAPIKD